MLPFLATARQAKRSAFLFSANIQKTVDKHTFFCYNNKAFADMAQQVEHILGKDEVTGSNPVISSSKKHLRKRTSHKDVRKYPMKSRLRVPNEENPSWTVGL